MRRAGTSKEFEDQLYAGHSLTRAQAKKLELELEGQPNRTDLRAQLVGYYHTHQFCKGGARELRPKHTVWFLQNERPLPPLFPFNSVHIIDRTGYQFLKTVFEAEIQKTPSDWLLLEQSANFMARHDPERADELYQLAIAHCSSEERASLEKDFVRFLEGKQLSLEILESWKSESEEKYFASGGLKCDGSPHRSKK